MEAGSNASPRGVAAPAAVVCAAASSSSSDNPGGQSTVRLYCEVRDKVMGSVTDRSTEKGRERSDPSSCKYLPSNHHF